MYLSIYLSLWLLAQCDCISFSTRVTRRAATKSNQMDFGVPQVFRFFSFLFLLTSVLYIINPMLKIIVNKEFILRGLDFRRRASSSFLTIPSITNHLPWRNNIGKNVRGGLSLRFHLLPTASPCKTMFFFCFALFSTSHISPLRMMLQIQTYLI